MREWRSRILHLFMFVLAVSLFAFVYVSAMGNRQRGAICTVADGWTVKYNDEKFENVNIADFRLPMTGKGDWIVATVTLPENLPADISMSIQSVFSVTRVYLDGEEIYEYGLEEYEKGLFLGYGTKFVHLGDNASSKELKITMFVTEDNAFSSIKVPTIYEETKAYTTYFSDNLVPFVLGITLLIGGILISFVTFCQYFRSYSMEKLFCIGVFSGCIGAWTICNYNLHILFINSIRLKSTLEFMSLYLVVLPLLLYFREDVENRERKIESFIYYAFLLIEIQLFVVACVCHLTNLVHLPVFLNVYHIFMGAVGIFIVILIIKEMISEKTHKILVTGVFVMIAVAIRDLVMFNINKYMMSSGSEEDYHSYVAIGAIVFVMAMLVDFIGSIKKQMIETAETRFLEKIAYYDVLTNLFTRRKCEEVFAKIDTRALEYIIVQFDLNNLKTINDEYGHEAGDELIKRFSNALKETFSEGETLGRMGGDEFIAIVTDAYDYKIDEKLKKLDALIEADNSENEVVKVSVSYGYCKSTELEKPLAHDVYMIADKRMYEQKESYYKKLGYKRRKYDNT